MLWTILMFEGSGKNPASKVTLLKFKSSREVIKFTSEHVVEEPKWVKFSMVESNDTIPIPRK